MVGFLMVYQIPFLVYGFGDNYKENLNEIAQINDNDYFYNYTLTCLEFELQEHIIEIIYSQHPYS
ncbi:hypothetical protein pb186bvf_007848 [Paramecium bursaria]